MLWVKSQVEIPCKEGPVHVLYCSMFYAIIGIDACFQRKGKKCAQRSHHCDDHLCVWLHIEYRDIEYYYAEVVPVPSVMKDVHGLCHALFYSYGSCCVACPSCQSFFWEKLWPKVHQSMLKLGMCWRNRRRRRHWFLWYSFLRSLSKSIGRMPHCQDS